VTFFLEGFFHDKNGGLGPQTGQFLVPFLQDFMQLSWAVPANSAANIKFLTPERPKNHLDRIFSPDKIRLEDFPSFPKHPNLPSNLLASKMSRWGYQKMIMCSFQGIPKASWRPPNKLDIGQIH
jgi:hypothetical protein